MFLRPSIWLATALMLSSTALAAQDDVSFFSGNYLAGRTAGRLRDTNAAIGFLEAALKDDPNNPVLIERLFQTEVSVGGIARAETLAAKVITFNSQQRMARLVLGLKEFNARRYAEARAQFAQSAYTPVGELTASLLNAWAYAGEGNLSAATKELKKLDGQDSFANYQAFHLALIDDYLGSNIKADPAYRQAFALSGSSLRVTQAYGNFLERNGRKDDAQKTYESFFVGEQRNVVIEAALQAM